MFLANPANAGKFISTGVWGWGSRQPNYLGEITLWAGLYLTNAQSFTHPAEYLSIISPLWSYFLLSSVSGVPVIARAGMRKWGKEPAYLTYLTNSWPIMFKLF